MQPKRIALYARCSTSDQSVALQLDGLRDYAQARGFEIVEEYVDEGVSGAKARRPALDRLLNDAHKRRFDAVLVWKLDRLGRSLSHLVRVVEQLDSLAVDLISLSDPGLDTTGPGGRLIFHVLASVAEFERELIRERTRAGMQAAKRRGKRIGRPRAQIPISKAQELLDAGLSMSAVAVELDVSRATLQRRLKKVSQGGPLSC